MHLHDHAWNGLNIMIVGKEPLVPMEMEQAIAAELPHVEANIDSFEEYSDALDFCKSNKNVGFIFYIGSSDPSLDIQEIEQLSKSYNSKGIKCYSVYIDTKESLEFKKRIIFKNTTINGFEMKDFDRQKLSKTLDKIWNEFTKSLYDHLIGKNLEMSLLSILSNNNYKAEYDFSYKLTNLLISKLNISWIESVSLRINCLIDPVLKFDSSTLKVHKDLLHLSTLISIPKFNSKDSAIDYLSKRNNGSVASKILILRKLILEKGLENTSEIIKSISSHNKPGVSGFIKVISNNSTLILSFNKKVDRKKA